MPPTSLNSPGRDDVIIQPQSTRRDDIVRNVIKNSLFSPNFFLTLITYGLLSYSVCLHCANLHTPLPFLFYLYDFQNMKTRHPDLFCAILSKRTPLGQLFYRSGVSALSGDSTLSRPANWWTSRSPSSSDNSADKASL